jgi:hypothetical protein
MAGEPVILISYRCYPPRVSNFSNQSDKTIYTRLQSVFHSAQL